MREIERRIYIDEEIFNNEYSYMYGDKKDMLVHFSYYHVKREKETCCDVGRNYAECLAFARYRANDGRYKNYEFLIYV